MKILSAWISLLFAFFFSPLLLGIINQTKAFFAGRKGQPLCQLYYDLWKLLHKGAVYSRTTSWIFYTGPVVGLAAAGAAVFLVPLGEISAVCSFRGDFIFLLYLLGLARFLAILSALDTGSSFEGMGASREAQFSVFSEIAIFLGFAALASATRSLSLGHIYHGITLGFWDHAAAPGILMAVSFFIVLLAENCRIPVDDPNTHLELTMIHEAMVLDHGGVDLAAILYSSALKLWVYGAFLIDLLNPLFMKLLRAAGIGNGLSPLSGLFLGIVEMGLLAVAVGAVESVMARLRLRRVPQLLIGASSLNILALALLWG
jgi:formate hydrogenlyase subunit 4